MIEKKFSSVFAKKDLINIVDTYTDVCDLLPNPLDSVSDKRLGTKSLYRYIIPTHGKSESNAVESHSCL